VDREELTYLKLRQICADSLRTHKEDFIHFLAESDLQADSDKDPYEAYCSQVQGTAAWGGHLEIQALVLALKAHVRVHTADMEPVDIGEEYDGPCIHICYLKHAYGLGEHYNSTRPVDMAAA
jgi:OTU domain-containing protein 6